MSYATLRSISEWLVGISFIAGVVLSILDLSLAGFAPWVWFLICGLFLLLIICTEVSQLREALVKKE